MAYELGYRVQPRENLSIDLAVFYNDYDSLITYEPLDAFSAYIANKMSAQATGFEMAFDWRPAPWWRMQAS